MARRVSTILQSTMKKHILPIFFLLTLVLFSCGGAGQNQNNKTVAPVVTTTGETTMEGIADLSPDKGMEAIDENVAEKLFRELYPEIKDTYSPNPFSIVGSYEEECEGCYSGQELDCYPLNDGGYLVAFTHDFGGPGCSTEYYFWTKYYKDGKLTDEVQDILPLPSLDELLNPDKTEDYKNDIAEFRIMFEKSPMDFIRYEFQPPMSLTVQLHPWDCEDAYNNMDAVMLDSYKDDKVPEYQWDGEKFVKQ